MDLQRCNLDTSAWDHTRMDPWLWQEAERLRSYKKICSRERVERCFSGHCWVTDVGTFPGWDFIRTFPFYFLHLCNTLDWRSRLALLTNFCLHNLIISYHTLWLRPSSVEMRCTNASFATQPVLGHIRNCLCWVFLPPSRQWENNSSQVHDRRKPEGRCRRSKVWILIMSLITVCSCERFEIPMLKTQTGPNNDSFLVVSLGHTLQIATYKDLESQHLIPIIIVTDWAHPTYLRHLHRNSSQCGRPSPQLWRIWRRGLWWILHWLRQTLPKFVSRRACFWPSLNPWTGIFNHGSQLRAFRNCKGQNADQAKQWRQLCCFIGNRDSFQVATYIFWFAAPHSHRNCHCGRGCSWTIISAC